LYFGRRKRNLIGNSQGRKDETPIIIPKDAEVKSPTLASILQAGRDGVEEGS